MEQLFVVTHPEPVRLEARPMQEDDSPRGTVALAYYYRGNILARGVVSTEALEAITGLLLQPVSVALAASEDDAGNIEARVCLVLPVDPEEIRSSGGEEGEEKDEPWKASVPTPPPEIESGYGGSGEERPRLALLPIGNVVRGAENRNHEDVVSDAREMLDNLLAGRAQDAVRKAIDDLLDSL